MDFSGGHVFTYSARKGTPAADFPDQIPHPVRKTRSAQLRALLEKSGEKYRSAFLEREMSVLWEQYLEEEKESVKLVGLTDNYIRVETNGKAALWNEFSRVRIDNLVPGGVWGTILEK